MKFFGKHKDSPWWIGFKEAEHRHKVLGIPLDAVTDVIDTRIQVSMELPYEITDGDEYKIQHGYHDYVRYCEQNSIKNSNGE